MAKCCLSPIQLSTLSTLTIFLASLLISTPAYPISVGFRVDTVFGYGGGTNGNGTTLSYAMPPFSLGVEILFRLSNSFAFGLFGEDYLNAVNTYAGYKSPIGLVFTGLLIRAEHREASAFYLDLGLGTTVPPPYSSYSLAYGLEGAFGYRIQLNSLLNLRPHLRMAQIVMTGFTNNWWEMGVSIELK